MKHLIFFIAVLQVAFALMSLCLIQQPWVAITCVILGCVGIISCVLLLENIRHKEERGRNIKN